MTLSQLSSREKTLAIIVAAILFATLNFFLIKTLIGKLGAVKAQLQIVNVKMDLLNKREVERTLWEKRETWLDTEMKPISDPQVAARDFTKSVEAMAKKSAVILETPATGSPAKQENYTSIPLRVKAKAEWKPMFEFLHELQLPGQFIVFDNLELRVDSTDKTKLSANMSLARWFAN